tara:strand:+ start:772 stop:1095 length:324 start_codon:yes stop_codon:yes gene_type:complete
MNKGPFKMQGMTFKGEAAAKKINLTKTSNTIKNSKFGKTKLGEAVGNVTEKAGNIQDKYREVKSNISTKIDSLLGNDDNANPANVDPIALDDASLPKVPIAKKKYKK